MVQILNKSWKHCFLGLKDLTCHPWDNTEVSAPRLCSNVFKTNSLCFCSQLLLHSEKLCFSNDNIHFLYLNHDWTPSLLTLRFFVAPFMYIHAMSSFKAFCCCCTFFYQFSYVRYNWIFFCDANNGKSDKMNDICLLLFQLAFVRQCKRNYNSVFFKTRTTGGFSNTVF